MRVTVLTQAYPSASRPHANAFVHSRNLWYADHGVAVTVASFDTRTPRSYEGIDVVPTRRGVVTDADVVVSHAPNMRNHARLLARGARPVVLFFHGFEALRTRAYYPEPYEFQRRRRDPVVRLAIDVYDTAKLRGLGLLAAHLRSRGSAYVFVSAWMRDAFVASVPGGAAAVSGREHVIPNAIHPAFVGRLHRPPPAPRADFVTFRPTIDQPKYAVDVVVELARSNPQLTFDLYGTGELVRRLGGPANLRHHDRVVGQAEMADLALDYRAALMPSRLDSQGVTACELASTGMPTYVSDIPVARSVLGSFSNVAFLDARHRGPLDASAPAAWCEPVTAPRHDFDPSVTCAQEVEVLRAVRAQPERPR